MLPLLSSIQLQLMKTILMGGGGGLLVPETKANDDDADIFVDETNKSSADDLGEKERYSIGINLMQDTIREQLMKDQYID
jgi:hypothetical protein